MITHNKYHLWLGVHADQYPDHVMNADETCSVKSASELLNLLSVKQLHGTTVANNHECVF